MKNCTYVLRTVLCLLVTAATWITPGFSQQIETGLTASTGDWLGFLQYTPKEYKTEGNVKHPLIIFLHGIGERGNGTTDMKYVSRIGLSMMIRNGFDTRTTWNGKTETFIVLSPQCPMKYGMWPQAFVSDLIAYAKKNLRIDTNRIYLTGLSMGGGGSLRYISTSAGAPTTVAATATICAPCVFDRGDYVAAAKLPVWAFHAADDAVALPGCTDRAINRINDFNPVVKPIRTMWPTGGHAVWDRVYMDTNYRWDGVLNIYEWFLGQNKSLAPNKLPVARTAGTVTISKAQGTVELDGSRSTDSDGKLVRYVWKKIAGPNAGVMTNRFGPNPKGAVSGLTIEGTYQYELSVVDDRAGFTRDTLTVIVNNSATVPNIAPVAKAGADITITLPTNKVKVDGSQSGDADGTIASWLWTKVSGPGSPAIAAASASSSDISGLVEGTYVFRLKVTDNKGTAAEDDVTIKVNPAPLPPNVAPVAKAGADITITLPANKVKVDGSQSVDADGTIASWLWTKVSGPGSPAIAAASATSTDITGLVEGTYVFKLKVTDNKGASAEDNITIKVNPAPPPPNKAPVAKAGADITITLPANKVKVDGSESDDADGTIVSWLWMKVSGPASSAIAAASASSTEITALVEGTYVFRLKVTDNKGASAEDDVTIKVNAAPPPPNVAPVAKAGNDIIITLPTNKVSLNGNQSGDADGVISTYLWTKVSGPAAGNIVTPNLSISEVNSLVEGTYVFRLKVTDNKGISGEDEVTVKVNQAPNVLPVARAGNDVTITLPTNKTKLSGSASSDADGSIVSYQWTKISGPAQFVIATAGAVNTDITNLAQGTYVFRLRVTDNRNGFADDQVVVTVKPAPLPPNAPPVAEAGADKTITLPNNSVTLNGALSTDADGEIASYLWSFVSGPSAYNIVSQNSPSTSITGLEEGIYLFRLEVRDDDGARDADTVRVKVNPEVVPPPAPNEAPVARINPAEVEVTLPQNATTLDGSASSDPDGTVTNYNWTKISGPASYHIENTQSVSTLIENLEEGVYMFVLQVKDNDGAIAKDTIRVTVHAGEKLPPVADAGVDMEVQLPAGIRLNGLDSYDPDGTIVSYQWTQVSGKAGITITNSTTTTPGVVDAAPGEYVFRLTVVDDDGLSASDEVTLTVIAAKDTTSQDSIPDDNLRYDEYMSVYPNPAVSNVNLKYNSEHQGKARVEIFNMSGMLLHVNNADKNQVQFSQLLNVAKFEKGVYYIRVTVNGHKKTTKFLKK